MAFDFSYPGTPADERGWGRGWTAGFPSRPDAYPGDIVTCEPFAGGVRGEIDELVTLLVEEMRRRGYKPKAGWCWGFAWRPTKRSDGTLTSTPSNHSWGLAIDINAPENVFGANTHAIPSWLPKLMRRFGFRWLGPPIRDWMHFDFAGTPADARAMTKLARRELAERRPVYRYAGKTYNSVSRAVQKLRAGLKRARIGDTKTIHVRGQQR